MKDEKKKSKAGDIGATLGHFGSAAAGLATGSIAMKTVTKNLPATVPAIVQKTVPGLAGMVAAYFAGMYLDNKFLKSAALGVGLAGFADVVKKTVGDKLPAMINTAIPTLSGPGAATTNYGSYPPSYYMENAFQGLSNQTPGLMGRGLGASAYALNGGGLGASAYALSGGDAAYSLSGRAN